MARTRSDRRGASRRTRSLVMVALAATALLAACSADTQTTAGPGEPTTTTGARGTAPEPTTGVTGTVPGTTPGTAVEATTTTVAPTSTAAAKPPAASSAPRPSVTAATTAAPAPTTAPPSAATPAPLAIATTSMTFVDDSRPTVSHGRQIAATRTLATTIAYPASGGPYPLIVFAHGYQLGPSHYTQVIDTIAAGGYVVAAPSFPLADAAVAGGNLTRDDIPNQSGDLSFVITQLSGSAGSTGVLAGKLDASRVGAVGHSDGADTVLDLGYTAAHRDGRVRGVVAMSPDRMSGSGSAPLLLTHGTADSIVPYSESQSVFANVAAPRYFMTLIGADHLPPVQGAAPWAAVLDRVILDLLDHDVAGEAGTEDAIVTDATVNGVSSVQRAG